MASITKRGAWQWQAKIRRDGYPSQSKTFDTKAEAQAWARSVENEMDRGVFVSRIEAERTSLSDALQRYEKEITRKKKGWRQETYRIKQWRADPLAKRALASLRSADFAEWRDKKLEDGLAASTVRNHLNLISHLFTIAAGEWSLEGLVNPISTIRKPSLPKGRERRLAREEEPKLFQACVTSRSPWLEGVVGIALETGMRLSEILNLRWEYVDIDARVARLPDTKNGSPRDVPLSTKAVRVLKGVPRSIDGQVFPITPDMLKQAYSDAVRRAGIKNLTFHDLRHEATSRLFEKGLGIMEVAAITGHKTLVMLKRYTHLRATDLARKLG
ncbi:MAG: site-specific integrase [Proteobacteria bacterium]|nr:site-specific integrase [Pseudomonadota bacterium]